MNRLSDTLYTKKLLSNSAAISSCRINSPLPVKKAGRRVLPEGCLSIPGYQGEVVRSEWVKVKAKDRNGKEIRIKGEGLLGQAMEHEIDHLDGVLYVDRLESEDKFYKIVAEDEEETETHKGEII